MSIFNNHFYSGEMAQKGFDDQQEIPVITFGVIADAQYCDCDPAGTRYYRSSLVKLNEAVSVFKDNNVSFIVNLGDLIDREFKSFSPVMEILNSSGIKIYHCRGNHDFSVENSLKNQIPVNETGDHNYFSFKKGNFRFIFLDGNEVSTYSQVEPATITEYSDYIRNLKDQGAINALDWNGGMGQSQVNWLNEQLLDAEKRDERSIIFCHFPVAPENIHNLLNYKEILPIVEKYDNPVAWFSGHNHSGNYANLEGVHFITMKGMVETEKVNAFAIAEVFNNRIEIRGYGNEKNLILNFN